MALSGIDARTTHAHVAIWSEIERVACCKIIITFSISYLNFALVDFVEAARERSVRRG